MSSRKEKGPSQKESGNALAEKRLSELMPSFWKGEEREKEGDGLQREKKAERQKINTDRRPPAREPGPPTTSFPKRVPHTR